MKKFNGLSIGHIFNAVLVFLLIGFGIVYFILPIVGGHMRLHTSVEWMTEYTEWNKNAVPVDFREENFSSEGKYAEPFAGVAKFCNNHFGKNWRVETAVNWRGLVILVMSGIPVGSNNDVVETWIFSIAYDETLDKMVLIDYYKFQETPSG